MIIPFIFSDLSCVIQGLNSEEKLDAYHSEGSSLISEKKTNILPDYNTSGSNLLSYSFPEKLIKLLLK